MEGNLNIENVIIQVRSTLNEQNIKLWLAPYYINGPVDEELEVSVIFPLL